MGRFILPCLPVLWVFGTWRELRRAHRRLLLLPVELRLPQFAVGGAGPIGQRDKRVEEQCRAPSATLGMPSRFRWQGSVRFILPCLPVLWVFGTWRELRRPHRRLLLLPVELRLPQLAIGVAGPTGQLDKPVEEWCRAPSPPLGLPSRFRRQGSVRFILPCLPVLWVFGTWQELRRPHRRLLLLPVELRLQTP